MCHWVLRVWKCGDSFFTKCSPCSFDRAVRDPSNPLNPLHPSIGPAREDSSQFSKSAIFSRVTTRGLTASGISDLQVQPIPIPTIDLTGSDGSLVQTNVMNDGTNNRTEIVILKDGNSKEVLCIPLDQIGKASQFGAVGIDEKDKCRVFEVVMQRKEATICPSCARSPRRAKLPAHARGCYGLS